MAAPTPVPAVASATEGRDAPPVRLLFAGTSFVVGGAERILAHLVRGLNRPPFAVEVLALREPGAVGEELRAEGIQVHSGLTGSGRIDPMLLPKLRGFLVRGRYDAIYFLDHAHAVAYGTLASLGTSVRVRVMPVHTTGQWGGRPAVRRPIRAVMGRLDRIIAIAEAQRRYLVETEGLPAERLCVIRNGIPLEQPDAEERRRRRAEVRAQLGVALDTPVVGITAVLRPEKNHEMLLDAFARAARWLTRAELWIVGGGPRQAFLEGEARRQGLLVVDCRGADAARGAPAAGAAGSGASANPDPAIRPEAVPVDRRGTVRFFGQRPDARRLMAGFDAAVLASHMEALPLSLIEAMDAALPIVATRVGSLPEMVEEGVSGHLVDPGDPESLAAALAALLRDPARAARYGERGQAIARERYAVETMAEATAELLLGLLAAKRGRGARAAVSSVR